MGVELKKTWN